MNSTVSKQCFIRQRTLLHFVYFCYFNSRNSSVKLVFYVNYCFMLLFHLYTFVNMLNIFALICFTAARSDREHWIFRLVFKLIMGVISLWRITFRKIAGNRTQLFENLKRHYGFRDGRVTIFLGYDRLLSYKREKQKWHFMVKKVIKYNKTYK